MLGKRRGTSDERWLWPDTLRAVRELRPRFCVFENPPAILTLESGRPFNGIISELSALGYVGFYDVLPAAAVGAGHLRERLFIVAAHANIVAESEHGDRGDVAEAGDRRGWFNKTAGDGNSTPRKSLPDSDRPRLERLAGNVNRSCEGRERGQDQARSVAAPLIRGLESDNWIETQSPVVPLVHGLPAGLVEASIRCVGNAVVPQCAEVILTGIREMIL